MVKISLADGLSSGFLLNISVIWTSGNIISQSEKFISINSKLYSGVCFRLLIGALAASDVSGTRPLLHQTTVQYESGPLLRIYSTSVWHQASTSF